MRQKSEDWWEKKLGIHTSGKTDRFIKEACNPYEPTDYEILERLAESGYITQANHFLDYGCGLGRSLFFMTARTGCRSTGIEYDKVLCEQAVQNIENSKLPPQYKKSIRCICADARGYQLHDEDRIYFFNPFAEDVLRIVLEKIQMSYYENPRHICLFFYYPYADQIAALMTAEGLSFVDEIDCTDLYKEYDPRERIIIFETRDDPLSPPKWGQAR